MMDLSMVSGGVDRADIPGTMAERSAPRRASRPTNGAASGMVSRESDRVELSDRARQMLETSASRQPNAAERGTFRADLVARVKSQIAAGTYDTDAKLEKAVDSMISASESALLA
jgi:anti-sigma28 factor (negative regulator of flagellin synthesis)